MKPKTFQRPTGFRLRVLTSAVLSVIGTAGPIDAAVAQADKIEEEIVVTGSRIQRQDYIANSPVVTVEQELFSNTSTVGIETVLNQLPQFVPSVLSNEFASNANQATATRTPGASVIDLRGLGSFRTLTLIDGRRAQPLNAALQVDTNSIPSSAIERVEIISGGASAVYGADAVAGVVNFILKDNFEGAEFTTRYGQTEEGDGETFQISGLIGADFADGRGNVMLGVEHAKRDAAYDINRSWIRDELDNPSIRGTEAFLAETYLDFQLDRNNRPDQGVLDSMFPSLPTCTLQNGTGNPCQTPSAAGKVYVNRTPDGTGTVFTGARAFIFNNGATGSSRYTGIDNWAQGAIESEGGLPYRKISNDGYLQENNLSALTTVPLERYSMFAKADYEFADNLSAYLQGSFAYSKTDTALTYSPAINNWTGTIPVGNDIWADSLMDDGITTDPAYTAGGFYDLNCPATGGCMEREAFPLPAELQTLLDSRTGGTAADPNADIRVHRVMDYFPERQTHNRNGTFQLIAGLEGELSNEWSWDASVGYGVSEADTLYEGYADLAQYIAVINSPNFGVNFFQNGISPTSSGRGSCTSGIPLFRDFEVSQDCLDTISVDMQTTGRLAQTTVDFNLAGDLFELPAGTVQFAVGADYREWDYQFINDHLNHVNFFVSQAIGLFSQGNTKATLDVKEVYGEVLIPVVSDLPGIQALNLELGYRLSDYNTADDTIDTYKFMVDWGITDWARIRTGYNRATRAPHIAEYFLGKTQGGATLSADPCSQNDTSLSYGAGSSNAAAAANALAICQDLMTPTAEGVYYNDPVDFSDQPSGTVRSTAFRKGNTEIDPEEVDTYTFGVVMNSTFDNPWLAGLNVTMDYYQIEVDNIIALEGANEIWRQCIISGDANSQACSLTPRDPFDGRLTLVDRTYTNRGNLTYSGIDLQLGWDSQFADLGFDSIPGGMAINSQITKPIDRETQDGPTAPVIDWIGTDGCDLDIECSGYDFQSFTTFNYFNGPLNASLRWNYWPSIDAEQKATNPSARNKGTKSYSVFSLSGSYDLSDQVTIRVGIDNLFNAEPPLTGGDYAADGGFVAATPPTLPQPARPSTEAQYDQLGRRYVLGLNITL